MSGHTVKNDYTSPLPYEYIQEDDLPESFSWGNVNGTSYLTKSLNQHLPQVCVYLCVLFIHAMLSILILIRSE